MYRRIDMYIQREGQREREREREREQEEKQVQARETDVHGQICFWGFNGAQDFSTVGCASAGR